MLTDIEGSTRLLQRVGDAYADVLARHHRIMRTASGAHHGVEVKTEGDSFFIVFEQPGDALAAAIEAQRLLAAEDWPGDATVAVRMGLHTGTVMLSDGEYVGVELHRAARISGVAHGGQIVVSEAMRDAVGAPEGVSLRSLGEHRLRDFDEPMRLFQVEAEGLRSEFPPLASLSARFELLPSELSSFVGREAEVERIEDLLTATRLLTLTGPGGTGKTRLSLEVARSCGERFEQGVAFVPLAAVTDSSLVAPTIRGALGFSEEPGRRSVETLTQKLRQHELLLMLDNFEQVTGAAGMVAELLSGTERMKILVTSRVGLHLDGEQEFMVPPMPVPITSADADALATNDSVRLFADRARQARPGFSLDAENAPIVAAICQRLDGLPLAIELAAARVKLLSPEALLTRLARSLDVLDTRGSGDRRRTLRGTIDWSHELLAPAEQVLFRRLAIFSGGASLEAVEALTPELARDGAPVVEDPLDALASLIDHSLVQQLEGTGADRYAMLETIREYGLEQLAASDEADTMASAHADWFLHRLHELVPGFTAGPEGLDEIEREHANVRAALRWRMEQGETQEALLAVADLWRFWHLRGHLREGLGVCEDVMALPGAETPTAAASGAMYAQASLLYWQGRAEEARADYVRALEIAQQAGSRPREAEAWFALAYVHMIFKDWEAAHEAARKAAALYAEEGDRLGAANARSADAYASSLAGDWEAAAAVLEDVVRELEAYGDPFWAMNHRITLAWTLIRLKRLDEALAMLRLNLDGSIELGDRSMENMAVQGMAMVAARRGDVELALRLAGAADAIADELGGKAPEELVIAVDPVVVVRELGTPEDEIARLTGEGRRLGTDEARELARGV